MAQFIDGFCLQANDFLLLQKIKWAYFIELKVYFAIFS